MPLRDLDQKAVPLHRSPQGYEHGDRGPHVGRPGQGFAFDGGSVGFEFRRPTRVQSVDQAVFVGGDQRSRPPRRAIALCVDFRERPLKQLQFAFAAPIQLGDERVGRMHEPALLEFHPARPTPSDQAIRTPIQLAFVLDGHLSPTLRGQHAEQPVEPHVGEPALVPEPDRVQPPGERGCEQAPAPIAQKPLVGAREAFKDHVCGSMRR